MSKGVVAQTEDAPASAARPKTDFVPFTGNPEAGDYADFERYLRDTGQLVDEPGAGVADLGAPSDPI